MEKLENLKLDENRLQQMEYLLDQSRNGHHLLFENSTIARVFSRKAEDNTMFKIDNLARIQDLLAKFMEKETLRKKRDFVHSLNHTDHDLLVRTYFNIIENSINSMKVTKH
ncbi:MAG: hypothetical protein AB8E15_02285 [Bdellovibrionales bacterium]